MFIWLNVCRPNVQMFRRSNVRRSNIRRQISVGQISLWKCKMSSGVKKKIMKRHRNPTFRERHLVLFNILFPLHLIEKRLYSVIFTTKRYIVWYGLFLNPIPKTHLLAWLVFPKATCKTVRNNFLTLIWFAYVVWECNRAKLSRSYWPYLQVGLLWNLKWLNAF